MNDKSFLDLGVSEATLKALDKKGFTSPSAIQTLVIPELLKERTNLIGQAQTGTGKTAAFAIPILEILHKRNFTRRDNGVQCVVMEPTRELVIQIAGVFNTLGKHTNVTTLGLLGGVEQEPQIAKLKN